MVIPVGIPGVLAACGQARGRGGRAPYRRGMARYRIDGEGVAGVASSLAADPHTLHAQAGELSSAVRQVQAGVGGDCPPLRHALERFRLLGAHGLDVVAESAAAFTGDLLTVAQEGQALERAVSQACVSRPYRIGAVD